MWIEPADSDRYVGQQPVFLPYFYYQAAKAVYPGTQRFGSWYSTPKAGECKGGSALGKDGCTWRMMPRARVVWGADLLSRGWNATYVHHWPLHEFGYNTTAQCLHNAPIMNESYAAMDGWVDADSACASAAVDGAPLKADDATAPPPAASVTLDDAPCAAQVACNTSQWAAWHCSECREGAAGPTDCLGACTSGFMFKEEFGAW